MAKLAVITTGGRQHLVTEGDTIETQEKLEGAVILKDLLSEQSVKLQAGERRKGAKVKILKFRAKTRELKRIGSRPQFTPLTVTNIT
ncbi:bL21 family ribosomal protein [Candidatus Berkelbacteria bacterium]|nr:bL21 family ribosomal protein [Candidatus Berkelbacteria bacterium]